MWIPLCRDHHPPSPVHPRPSPRGLGTGLDGPALAPERAAAGCLSPGKPGDDCGCLARGDDGALCVPQKEMPHG